MRKRTEISYLTFLGLSLTVVITTCNERSADSSYLAFTKKGEHNIRFLNSDELVDFLKVNKNRTNTYVFDNNHSFQSVLNSNSEQFIRMVEGSLLLNTSLPTFSNSDDWVVASVVATEIGLSAHITHASSRLVSNELHFFLSARSLPTHPVRAGPLTI